MREHYEAVVLVTGVGDTVGQGIVKAARQSHVAIRVVGTDADPLAVGLRWVDAAAVLPHCARADDYLEALSQTCLREGVQLILPGSERELALMSEHVADLTARTGAHVVAAAPELLSIALDKWRTCQFLESAGLRFPRYARGDAVDEIDRLVDGVGYPLIAKPVHGTGSRGLLHITSPAELEAARNHGVPMVLQEALGTPEREYSVEVWTRRDGTQVGAISYRRLQLVAGDTYSARVESHGVVEREARAVAAALGALGPCNVQLRMTERGPVTFEINPRFSGGVAMRAHFGFNEVDMAVREMVLGLDIPAPRVTSGYARRHWGEVYFDDGYEPVRPAWTAGTRG